MFPQKLKVSFCSPELAMWVVAHSLCRPQNPPPPPGCILVMLGEKPKSTDLNIHKFWYLWGVRNGSWNNLYVCGLFLFISHYMLQIYSYLKYFFLYVVSPIPMILRQRFPKCPLAHFRESQHTHRSVMECPRQTLFPVHSGIAILDLTKHPKT